MRWGSSDKPTDHRYTAANQVDDLDAVIEHLRLGPAVLVAHDASGPPAIDWARHYVQLNEPQEVARLILTTPEVPIASGR